MEPELFNFEGHDGTALQGHAWVPEGSVPRAHLLVVHGIGEHGGRYDGLANALLLRGIATHTWDQRGHGRSEGQRGHIRSWDDYCHDLNTFVTLVEQRQADDRPVILLGHSMGALVVLDAAMKGVPGVGALVVSGVPMEPKGPARPHLVLLARMLSKVWPRFALRLPLDDSDLVSTEERRRKLAEDPLLHRQVSARWGAETLAAVARVRSCVEQLELPLLILHGERDRVNFAGGARWLYKHAGSPDKTLKIYAETRHEPHNDVESETATRDLAEWIEARL